MKTTFSYVLLLSLALSNTTFGQDITKAVSAKMDEQKAETSKADMSQQDKKSTAKDETLAPKTEQKKEHLAAAPQEHEKKEISIQQTEGKEVKVAGPATAAPTTLWKKAEGLQKEMEKFLEDAVAYSKANPKEQEKVLEQLGMFIGLLIAGLEQVTGKSILQELAQQEQAMSMPAPAAPKNTKQPERPLQAIEEVDLIMEEAPLAQPTESLFIEEQKPIATKPAEAVAPAKKAPVNNSAKKTSRPFKKQ